MGGTGRSGKRAGNGSFNSAEKRENWRSWNGKGVMVRTEFRAPNSQAESSIRIFTERPMQCERASDGGNDSSGNRFSRFRPVRQQLLDTRRYGGGSRLPHEMLLICLHERRRELWACRPIAHGKLAHVDECFRHSRRVLWHYMDAVVGTHDVISHRGVKYQRSGAHSEQKGRHTRHV